MESSGGSPGTGGELSLVDRIYNDVKEDIFGFFLLPGDRFTETELAQRMGASRTPVREALFRLQLEGYIELHSRSGWQVLSIDFSKLKDLYEFRVLLERDAALHLLERKTDAVAMFLESMSALWKVEPESRLSDTDRVFAMDESFHSALVASRENSECLRVHRSVCDRIRIVRRLDFTRPDRIEATYREHSQILELLQNGDRGAVELLCSHIEASRKQVNELSLYRLQMARKMRSLS